MAMLVDVHAHLDHPSIINKVPEILSRAEKNGIHKIITNGIDQKSNRVSLDLAEKYGIVEAALGVYPPDALKKELKEALELGFIKKEDLKNQDFDPFEEIEFIKKHIKNLAAVGEIGLDYKNCEDIELQKKVFKKQIELAIEFSKPVIIHSRKAENDVLDILEESKYKKVILHCFCGKKGLIKRAVDLGFSFSVPANITKSHHFQNLVNIVPLTRILTETDSPFLSPNKDEHNEPSNVMFGIKKIAEIKNITESEAKNAVFMNFQALF